jgi:hypothetical protein
VQPVRPQPPAKPTTTEPTILQTPQPPAKRTTTEPTIMQTPQPPPTHKPEPPKEEPSKFIIPYYFIIEFTGERKKLMMQNFTLYYQGNETKKNAKKTRNTFQILGIKPYGKGILGRARYK